MKFSCFSVCVALKMWKAAAGQSVSVTVNDGGDDWETDPDFEVLVHGASSLQSPFSSPHSTCTFLLHPSLSSSPFFALTI